MNYTITSRGSNPTGVFGRFHNRSFYLRGHDRLTVQLALDVQTDLEDVRACAMLGLVPDTPVRAIDLSIDGEHYDDMSEEEIRQALDNVFGTFPNGWVPDTM